MCCALIPCYYYGCIFWSSRMLSKNEGNSGVNGEIEKEVIWTQAHILNDCSWFIK